MNHPEVSSSVFSLVAASFLVGLIHSLTPAHWAPVAMLAKTRKWSLAKTWLGATVVGTSHTIVTLALCAVVVSLKLHERLGFEEDFERYGGLVLVIGGAAFAIHAAWRHSRCHGHEHHGPGVGKRNPWIFLALIGTNPCLGVLPPILAAAPHGWWGLLMTAAGFGVGVFLALLSTSAAARWGTKAFDHPLLEHYGDVVTGSVVAGVGLGLFFLPHFGH